MKRSRQPDHSLGRFFVSPVLGCSARCSFCYIFSEGYNGQATANTFGADESRQWIERHEQFRQGRHGSIISIGAWGDPFPRGHIELQAESVRWLRVMCTLGNPIQMMSRFTLRESVIEEVASCQVFPGQILFSTSLSTLNKWTVYERGSDPPESRLLTLRRLSLKGIPVNVMIKPYLPGITDCESDEIGQAILDAGVTYCVVGSLHWNNQILSSLERTRELTAQSIVAEARQESFLQLFDCTSDKSMHAFHSSALDGFIKKLQQKGLRVFKKSACVNSHLLGEKNAVLLFENDLDALCVRCGVCDNSNVVRVISGSVGQVANPDANDEIIRRTVDHVRSKFMGESSGHDWWHVFRVWKLASHICRAEGADLFVVQLAALLHELDDWKFHNDVRTLDPKAAREWLCAMDVGDSVVKHVCEIILDMPFKGAGVRTAMSTLEGQVVQDADRLDAIGAIGVARTFAYGGHAGRAIYDPDHPPQRHDSFEAYRQNNGPTINHFYEKLLLLRDRMNTATGRVIANERHEFLSQFLKQFLHEWGMADQGDESS